MVHAPPNPAVIQSKRDPISGLSLKRNFSWTFAGNIVNALSQFCMLIALARLGNTEMVGQYGLGLAVSAPVFLLTGMSLRSVQVTDVNDEYSFRTYAALRAITSVLGIAIISFIVVVLEYSRETAIVVMLLGLSKAIEGLSDIIFGVFQKHEQMDKIAKSMILKALATVVVFALVLAVSGNLILSVASISMVWLVRLATFDIPNLARLRGLELNAEEVLDRVRHLLLSIPQSRQALLSLAILSLPVGISSALISLGTNVPRYAIEWSVGTAQLGVFTVLAYPLVIGNTVISALAQSSLPRLARYFTRRERSQLTTLMTKLLAIGVGLAVVAIVLAVAVGRDALRAVFGDEYAEEHRVFLILVLGMGVSFINWFLNSALQAMRAFRTMLTIQILATALTAAMAAVLIPTHGLVGAGIVVVFSQGSQVVVKVVVVGHKLLTLEGPSHDRATRVSRL